MRLSSQTTRSPRTGEHDRGFSATSNLWLRRPTSRPLTARVMVILDTPAVRVYKEADITPGT
jgi:hypothetical protein